MNRHILTIFLLLTTSAAFSQGKHDVRINNTENNLNNHREKKLQECAELEASLKERGIQAKEIDEARKLLEKMTNDKNNWRNLKSRSTSTYKAAEEALYRYLSDASKKLTVPKTQLAALEKAEFDAWARQNPGAAKVLELEKRVKAAEKKARNAEDEASSALAVAKEAQFEANQSRIQAEEAKWKARQAENRAIEAEQNN